MWSYAMNYTLNLSPITKSFSEYFKIDVAPLTQQISINNIPLYNLFIFSIYQSHVVFEELYTKRSKKIDITKLDQNRIKIKNFIQTQLDNYEKRETNKKKIQFTTHCLPKYLTAIMQKNKLYQQIHQELNKNHITILPIFNSSYLGFKIENLVTIIYNIHHKSYSPMKLPGNIPNKLIPLLLQLFEETSQKFFDIDFNNPRHLLIYAQYK